MALPLYSDTFVAFLNVLGYILTKFDLHGYVTLLLLQERALLDVCVFAARNLQRSMER